MSIFNQSVAELLQQFSFPLELIGFTLVILEVYRSDVIDRMENWVDRTALGSSNAVKHLVGYAEAHVVETAEVVEHESITLAGAFLQLLFVIGFLIVGGIVLGILWAITMFFHTDPPEQNSIMPFLFFGLWAVLGTLIYVFTLIPAFLLSLLAIILKVLDRMSGGYAMASFGIVLAAIGLLFELYQVIEMCEGVDVLCYKFW